MPITGPHLNTDSLEHLNIKVNIGSLQFDMMLQTDVISAARLQKHNHYAFEVHYFISGAGTLHIGSREEPLQPGSTLLIGPGVYHSINMQPGNPLHRHFIQFTFVETSHESNSFQKQESLELLNFFTDIQYHLFLDEGMEQTICLIEDIYQEMQLHLVGFYSQIQILFTQLIIRLIRSLSAAPSRFMIPQKMNDDRRTLIIDDFFDRYREDLTIDDLAAQLHLSTKQTNRILEKYYHTSFKQKQLTTRVQVAMDLLRTSSMTIEAISEHVGYTSSYNFCKLFKQKTGLTPTEYRDQPALK
ncbi:AraC family transcriptional regulator [Paenibacillus eucommiae]|uniref:AraC-like DNA-binding protein/mannose-6-phosphate isomerase-like protein (Cupin superfamily) n=1 Tax=Paenibacillus eucommiae TaxID=1355755 RepID=A0ABS4IYS8_9BACL|nr:helix-turn-helix domain-containing protein [Paenibacillus eucommiae]MBP1992200.1 AraC-like DNA-binding protein/mannose-6-phosphate isomerase-like protein (cupin superfamily) [Paenibacillus eucommiae]